MNTDKPFSNPASDTLFNLDFYATSLNLLQPCTSLLADSCRLSIPQVSHALPSVVKAIIYQCLTFIHTHGQAMFDSEILQNNLLSPLTLTEKFGLNFNQLQKLKADYMPFRQTLFNRKTEGKSDNFAWLVGLLVERTGLNVRQVTDLFDHVALLTLKLLADIRTLTTTPHPSFKPTPTDKAFFSWFSLQPILIASFEDKSLIRVLGYRSEKPLGQLLHEQRQFHKNNAPNTELTAFATIISQYKITQPLGIIPTEFLAKPKRPNLSTAQWLDNTPSIFMADKSLTNTKNSTRQQNWQQKLQRHWMVTAGVLTAMVFGGVALIAPPKEKPKPQLTHQQAEAMPHDVAIIKVDSTVAETTASNVVVTKSSVAKTASTSPNKSETKAIATKDSTQEQEKNTPKNTPNSDTPSKSAKSNSVIRSDKTKTVSQSDNKKSADRPKDKAKDKPKKSDSVKKKTTNE